MTNFVSFQKTSRFISEPEEVRIKMAATIDNFLHSFNTKLYEKTEVL